MNAVAAGFGLERRRKRKGFDAARTGIGFATVVGGCIALAFAYRLVPGRIGRSRLARAAVIGLGAFAIDRFAMNEKLVPALRRALGAPGLTAKYLALGAAAAAR